MASDTIYFDSYAALGKWAGKDSLAPWQTTDHLRQMEQCAIHGALVYAHVAAETHPDVGNPLVDTLCQTHARFYPCWVVMPHHTGEFPQPKELLRQMAAANVRAVKIFPQTYGFAVNDLDLGPLLAALEEAGIVTIFDRSHDGHPDIQIGWDEIRWVGETFPRLKLLLHGVRWEATRQLTPLAHHLPNLYFEFSNYQGNRMLEYWCREIGHERLLFGTQAMQKSLGAARAYVDYSELTPDQRNAIAGGNLARLLGVALPAPYPEPAPTDAIVERAWEGLPIDDQIVIDAHAHFTQMHTQGATRVFMNEADMPSVVARNQRLGVDITCASSWTGIWTDWELGTQDTVEALAACPPGSFIAYATLDPLYLTDWDAALDYCYRQHRMMGMKPYFPRQGFPYNDPRYAPWWEFGNRCHLFAKMHPSDNFVAEMHDLAPRYPNVNFLLAHSGWTWRHAREHVALAQQYPNCHCEITFTSVTNGTIEWMVQEAGEDRVIYGSDTPMRDPFPQFGWVAYADISEQAKRKILGLNMEKIIAQVQLPPP